MTAAISIAVGAAAGALLRWRLATALVFPWGTTLANLLGCGILGLLVARLSPSSTAWALLAVGFCGSLTTFSSFIFDLWRQGPDMPGLTYLTVNLLGGFLIFLAFFSLARPGGP